MARVYLTDAEISALLALCAVCDSNPEGEGDYQEFDYRSMDTAERKLIAALNRPSK